MLKKIALMAAVAAISAAPLAAGASQGMSIQAASVTASVQILQLCNNVSMGPLNWGPIMPNGTSSNGTVYYAASNLQNDCVSGTIYQVATFDNCALSNGSATIPYTIFVNEGPGTNFCGAPSSTPPAGAPTFTASTTAGGTNNLNLVGAISTSSVTMNMPAGTYTDHVTAVVYF